MKYYDLGFDETMKSIHVVADVRCLWLWPAIAAMAVIVCLPSKRSGVSGERPAGAADNV
jgi:hypothetical protein